VQGVPIVVSKSLESRLYKAETNVIKFSLWFLEMKGDFSPN